MLSKKNVDVLKAKIHYMINYIRFVRLSYCIKKIRNVLCELKCDFLYDFWFYIKAIKRNSFTDIFQGFLLDFKNIIFHNPSQWLFPK